MKIGFISSYFYDRERMNYGGFPFVYNIIERLSTKDSFVIAAGWPKKPAKEMINNIKVFRTPSVPFDYFGLHFFGLGLVGLKTVLKEKPDILNSQDADAAFLFKKLNTLNKKIPKILSLKALIRGWLIKMPLSKNSGLGIRYAIRDRREMCCVKNSDEIIVPSNYFKKEVCELCNFEEEKIHVIANGIDTELFKPVQKESNEPTLFFAGGNSIRKGANVVIDSFIELKKEFKELKLIVTGSELKQFQDKLEKNNIRIDHDIINLGRIPYSQMPYYINQSDIVLHPAYHETFGAVLAEAMACEKPVIATNATAIPEVIGDCGILTMPGNIEEFTEAIKNLLVNEKKQKQLGRKGRKRVIELFTLNRCANNYLKLFNKIKYGY